MPVSDSEVSERLERVNGSQASVQAASTWIMENKEHIDVITQGWLKTYQQGTESLKIALIYVMNDVVQTAKKDKDKSISVAFHPHFINAIVLASETVQKPIKKILNLFRERHIFPKHVIDEMQSAMNGNIEVQDDDEPFELDVFIKTLDPYAESSLAIDKARVILDNINFELDDDRMDKMNTEQLCQVEMEVDLMIKKLQTFLDKIQVHSVKSTKLQSIVNKSKGYFQTQLKDVAMVQDAYERYAKGISERITQLEPIVRSGVMPGESPPRDAPSPSPGEDPFKNMDDDDMEMDDEDRPVKEPTTSFVSSQDYVARLTSPNKTYRPTTIVQPYRLDPRAQRQHNSRPNYNIPPPNY